MSARSVITGLAGAVLIAALCFFNDMVMKSTFLIGSYLPTIAFGMLILFLMTVNPLLGRFSRRGPFTAGELGVVFALLLFGCYVPGRGLGHHFTNVLMMPHHYAASTPAWGGEPPALAAEQVLDWAKLWERVRGGRELSAAEPLRRAWDRLPGELRAEQAEPRDQEWRARFLDAVNAGLTDPAFHEGISAPAGGPECLRVLAMRPRADWSPDDHARFSRGLLDQALEGVVRQRRAAVLELVPPQMLADVSRNKNEALGGFVSGLASGDKRISPLAVPWYAWWRTLLFWVPLLFVFSLAVLGLSLVLHRQWSSHEHLPYTTVEFARILLPEPGHAVAPVFRNRLYWFGFLAVLGIHMVNYAHVWWPDYLIPIRLSLDLGPLTRIAPLFGASPWILFWPQILFSVIGIAYFLASDVAFSLGVAPYLYALAIGIAASYGYGFGSGMLVPSVDASLYAGGYVGMFCVLAYSGRHYYRTVFARSVGLPARDQVERHAVSGARLFLVAAAVFVALLIGVGVEWPLAVYYTAAAVMIFTVISRLLAEAGVYFLQPSFYPCSLLWGFMGAAALGREQLLLLGIVSSLLLIDPREAIMPFAVSALQMAERVRARLGRVMVWGIVGLALSFLVAVPVSIYWQYQMGTFRAGDGWASGAVPAFAFNSSAQIATTLEAQDSLAASQNVRGLARFARGVPQTEMLTAFAITFGLVLLFTFLRRRFPGWPLHPLIFLVLANYPSRMLAFSFLVGWAIKKVITKYGGARLYQALKPLMVGLIAGEVSAALVTVLVGAVYYLVTGSPPKLFRILPG